jgi:hypothetical protein
MFGKQQFKPGKSGGLFGENPGIMDLLIVAVLCFAAFIFFDQWYDMAYTSQQSSDLLDCLFSGKFFNFYSYVIEKGAEGKYVAPYLGGPVGAAYNIVVYIILAVWELPIYIANHISSLSQYEIILELWGRLLGIVMACVGYFQITSLAKTLMSDKRKAKWAGYYFISSPLIFYCVIIRNQLDIVSVVLIILALNQYFKKNYMAFSIFMAVASCFKLMPFFIVIPILFLAEKRAGKLIKYLSVAISLYAVTNIVPLLVDPGYITTLNMVTDGDAFTPYLFKAVITGGVSNYSVFLLIYFLICVIAYVVKPKENEQHIYALLLAFASLANFFMFLKWHPQWIVLLLPFITLLVFSLFDFEFGVLLDMALTLGFLLTSILMHLTYNIFTYSIFYTITFGSYSSNTDFNPIYAFFSEHGYSTIIPSTLFFAGIVSLILVVLLNLRRHTNDGFNSFDNNYKISRGLLYARSSLILIFILPPVISYLSHPIV